MPFLVFRNISKEGSLRKRGSRKTTDQNITRDSDLNGSSLDYIMIGHYGIVLSTQLST